MIITSYIKLEDKDDIIAFDCFDEFYMFYSKYCDKNITKDKNTFYNDYSNRYSVTYRETLSLIKNIYIIWKIYNI